MRAKDWLKVIVLCVIVLILPKLMTFYIICGLLDFRRSKTFSFANWKRYFLGNGILTWVLSPFNLFCDLISHPNKGVYKLEDLPEQCQAEIKELMLTADNNPIIIDELSKRMAEKKRGMIFFKWYGKNTNNSISIPEFHKDFKYIKTIGVSVFNKQQSTSIHYGPLRISFRMLYNLVPTHNENIYICAANQKHFWHDNPLFIFDDTLVHQSVNRSENLRYCMFVDILRPAYKLEIMHILLRIIRTYMFYFNRIFYSNWDIIK